MFTPATRPFAEKDGAITMDPFRYYVGLLESGIGLSQGLYHTRHYNTK
jgi:hypothetical protein